MPKGDWHRRRWQKERKRGEGLIFGDRSLALHHLLPWIRDPPNEGRKERSTQGKIPKFEVYFRGLNHHGYPTLLLSLNSRKKVFRKFSFDTQTKKIVSEKRLLLRLSSVMHSDFGLRSEHRFDATSQLPRKLDDGSMDFGILHCGREIGSIEWRKHCRILSIPRSPS